MKIVFQVLAVGALLWLHTAPASAADCICDQWSAEGCSESATISDVPATPPLWCERSDDPRCMPASTHGTSVPTLVPVVMSWVQPIRCDAPPSAGIRLVVEADGDAQTEHSRRVDRPPR